VCYTAVHGNKETLKISHFNSQEAFCESFITDEEGGFITHKESGGRESAHSMGAR
jgi:hypothetical protein